MDLTCSSVHVNMQKIELDQYFSNMDLTLVNNIVSKEAY